MILCWFYRKLISHGPEEEDRCPDRLRRHLASCASCRQFHAAEMALVRRLRREASAYLVPPPPFLAGRIAAAVRRAGPAHELRRRPRLLSRGGAAIALAVGALSVLVLWQRPFPPAPVLAPAPRASFAGFDFALPDGERLLKISEALDRPLDGEMRLVVNDARMAVQALAQNFLPKGLE